MLKVRVRRCVLKGRVRRSVLKGRVRRSVPFVWRQARRHRVPAVGFVNKMDREGAQLGAASESLAARLGLTPLPVQLLRH